MLPETPTDLAHLETERVNPATVALDRLSPLELVRAINAEDARVAAAVERELPNIAAAVEGIAARLRQGGRLLYFGAGTSGRLGVLDASECPPTFGTPPELVVGCIAGGDPALRRSSETAEDQPEGGQAEVARLNVTAADAVVGIAASGRTPYVLGAIREARARDALTIGLACNRDTPLAALVEIMIAPIVGPEVIAGSTRLKAGTAQKMVLNMLTTGSMVLLGKTYGNLMVDLHASNSKLRQRAIRIVQTATGLDPATAADLLAAADGEAKTAIVAGRAGLAPFAARARLAASDGSVRRALGEE